MAGAASAILSLKSVARLFALANQRRQEGGSRLQPRLRVESSERHQRVDGLGNALRLGFEMVVRHSGFDGGQIGEGRGRANTAPASPQPEAKPSQRLIR